MSGSLSSCAKWPRRGTMFTSFTGTKVQKLTQKALQFGRPRQHTSAYADVRWRMLYWYESANTDAEGAAVREAAWSRCWRAGIMSRPCLRDVRRRRVRAVQDASRLRYPRQTQRRCRRARLRAASPRMSRPLLLLLRSQHTSAYASLRTCHMSAYVFAYIVLVISVFYS